ncbi:phosphoglycerate dehydrogenase [Vallitalea guaymasensis]|uniref:D-3-phosphoglycerate dehydrogenase n=1 Tax=Vallitalea guaymasensis TaxID=1185412 RepID=A0A8J8MDI8_9FIRM|nr:phosphoglycerate dehydrogenase [Vallitalea guaymasensis]QUH30961.1 phosphoglycerate dehydrogenase [Vallitalea guaymasensis]
MYKIKTLNNIAEEGLNLFNDKFKIVDDADANGILLRSYKMHDMELPNSLEAIGRAGAGVNNIPIDRCSEKGIVVFNTPGANANAVKELVMAGLLLASRDIVGAIDWAKTLKGKGEEVPKLVEAGKSNFVGPEVRGKTLGVIGLGAIGVLVANAAKRLGMEVLGYDPFISVESAWELNHNIQKSDSLDELFMKSDYITIHVPLMDATKGMINEEKINLMKDGVRLLNFSRAGLCNDTDLEKALESGKVARYITDFPYDKVLNMKNVVCIPHLGASTPESEVNCAVMAVSEVKDYIENGNITNSVNYPECNMGACNAAGRIAVNHKNIPYMVSNITTALASKNINIIDMINKSKKDWAYTLIDVESKITDEIVDGLKEIEGIVKVRVLK